MMEKWNIGNADVDLILFFALCVPDKNRFPCTKRGFSTFQHPIIPTARYLFWRQNQSSLTWRRGPGFQCQNMCN
jgi:hypothetical protein